MPSVSSSDLTCRLTAPCVTESSCSAAVKLQSMAVASKARSELRDVSVFSWVYLLPIAQGLKRTWEIGFSLNSCKFFSQSEESISFD